MSPVRAMGNQVKSVLGSIQEALMVMFGGWLSWEFLRFIGAWADDNKKLMQNIKKRITSAVAISIGILGGLKWGLGKVISSIAGLGLAAGALVFVVLVFVSLCFLFGFGGPTILLSL